MFGTIRSFLLAAPLALVACASSNSSPNEAAPQDSDSAATQGDTQALDRATAESAVAGVADSGSDCRVVALVGEPIAFKHLEDPNIQQTAAYSRLAFYGGTDDPVRHGTVVATIVGKEPTGQLLGNHAMTFTDGILRTKNDVIALTPTSDSCVFHANVQMNFFDGTGAFAGYSGSGTATADLNFCGAPGRAVIYGKVCKAAAAAAAAAPSP
jgi:hypothetical protein